MIDKLIVLKEDKPILFNLILAVLAIPLVGLFVIAVFNPALREWLVLSAKRLIDKTKKQDEKIKSEINQAQEEIDKLDQKIENIDQQLEAINNTADANWHKKEKK